jgi:hypothetical protein
VLCLLGTVAAALALSSAPALGAVKHPFVTSFGSFTHVGGVAVDQTTGDVYVLDTEAEGGSLLKFDASGNPLKFTGLAGEPTAITGLGAGGTAENELAVDNSTGPAKGDVYVAVSYGNGDVVDVIAPDGTPLGTLSEENAPWGTVCGVATDPSGNVYVSLYGPIDKFTPKANPVANSDFVASISGANESCNVAADSDGNVFGATWPEGPIWRFPSSQFGSSASGSLVDGKGTSLAVDSADDHVYVNERTRVSEFGAHGEPLAAPVSAFGESGQGAIAESEGIGVDASSGEIYVPDGKGQLSVFGPGVLTPTVVTGEATREAGFSATLGGSVNPVGSPVTECKFEYGTSSAYGQSVPCATNPGSGSSPVPVSAAITGLTSGVTYHFRLVAANAAGEELGEDETFASAQVVITGEAANITLEGATLGGSVNPEGLAVTECKFEYGLTTTYGESTPCASLPGGGNEPVAVSASLSNLTPNGKYHFRLAITNANGVSFGGDRAFTAAGPFDAGLPGLPDGRGYELVTSNESTDFELYAPDAPGSGAEFSNVLTQRPFQAAANGEGVAFVGSPSEEGNESAGEGGGNEYLARRSSDGVWTQANISPYGAGTALFQGFSSDLSVGFLDAVEPLAPGVPGYGEPVQRNGTYDDLYQTDTAGTREYAPAFTVTPPYRSKTQFETANVGHIGVKRETVVLYAGASADSRHVLFEANDALTPEAEGGSAANYREVNNLYESVDGQLKLVNVLPDGTTKANATFGGPNSEAINGFYASPDLAHVISNDGTRVFWTDLNTGHIYVRENGTTVEISSAGQYWGATADGSRAFYTNGDLYEYDVASGTTTDLTPGVEVQGVIGASENGEYIYYVTAGLDLDLWHDGATTGITALKATDNGNGTEGLAGYGYFTGDWRPGYADRTAEVAPDGSSVVYVSSDTVKVYDADDNKLYCASCGWGGSQGYLPLSFSNTYQKRWISEGGSRVFFDSKQALVPQDGNGRLDVYEWERPGAGSCTSSDGCIYLLTGGTSQDESFLADASSSGEDVFVITRTKLALQDDNEKYDLYDARVGGSEPIAAPVCTGTGCQGIAAAPPIFSTPASFTFEGVGNFAAPAPVVKPKPKPKAKPKKKKKSQKCKRKRKKGARGKPAHCARRARRKGARS